MLWSDPKNEPPKDMRDAQAMVRRLALVLILTMLVAVYVLGVGPF
ncbi:morphogenic membrane protein MmpB [Streptomyces sp. NPDC059874]